ncbi:MAG: ribonuclease P protein component [Bacilli bacterium]|nr:ribonuclease P protein component [Bacilli bacterium]
MNKKYIIRKNEEVKDIIGLKKKIVCNYFIIYYRDNSYEYNRYCISISKKLGKAHERNLFKRRIKDILMKNNFNCGKDCVIILREAIKSLNYRDIENALNKEMRKL